MIIILFIIFFQFNLNVFFQLNLLFIRIFKKRVNVNILMISLFNFKFKCIFFFFLFKMNYLIFFQNKFKIMFFDSILTLFVNFRDVFICDFRIDFCYCQHYIIDVIRFI